MDNEKRIEEILEKSKSEILKKIEVMRKSGDPVEIAQANVLENYLRESERIRDKLQGMAEAMKKQSEVVNSKIQSIKGEIKTKVDRNCN